MSNSTERGEPGRFPPNPPSVGEVKEHRAQVVLKNKYGLHARPCTLIAQTAKKFESQVFLGKDGTEVDAKSIFGMLTLAAECGASLSVRARGPDAEQAVAKLSDVIGSFQAED